MKKIASISFLLISSVVMAQSPINEEMEIILPTETVENSETIKNETPVAMELVGANILFRFHENKIRPAVPIVDTEDLVLTSVGCELTKVEDGYLVKPGNYKTASITVSKNVDGELVPLRTIDYRVMNIRVPDVKLGGALAGEETDLSNLELTCSYPTDFILDSKF